MKHSHTYFIDLENETLKNTDYRRAMYTFPGYLQLVLMSILPDEEIGWEVHDDVTQFIRVEEGIAVVQVINPETLDMINRVIGDGEAVIIPTGTQHNVYNPGDTPVKLYSIYTPPEHPSDTVQKRKSDEN